MKKVVNIVGSLVIIGIGSALYSQLADWWYNDLMGAPGHGPELAVMVLCAFVAAFLMIMAVFFWVMLVDSIVNRGKEKRIKGRVRRVN